MTINLPDLPSIASWKSTLVGMLSGLLAVYEIYSSVSHGLPFAMALKDPLVVQAFLVALIGWIAKDSNVTGGTKGTPSTPQALAAANQAPATGVNAPNG